MRTSILTTADLCELVQQVGVNRLMDELIERLESALRGYDEEAVRTPPRHGLHYEAPQTGLVEWMPVQLKGRPVVMKMVSYHPANPERAGLPTILSTISAYDNRTGRLLGLTDGTLLTAMRTGAASAVASRVLARTDSSRLGLIGSGAQAVTQLHALSRVFPLRECLYYDIAPEATASFPRRVEPLSLPDLELRAAGLEEVVGEVDILCVATTVPVGHGPVFEDLPTRPWLHVNAVGSDFPGKVEIPRPLLEASLVCPDFPDQALIEGECQQLKDAEIGPTLAALVQKAPSYHTFRSKRTVFDSTGWALEDQVALDLFLHHAALLGLGTQIELELHAPDGRDPYHFLTMGTSSRGRSRISR